MKKNNVVQFPGMNAFNPDKFIEMVVEFQQYAFEHYGKDTEAYANSTFPAPFSDDPDDLIPFHLAYFWVQINGGVSGKGKNKKTALDMFIEDRGSAYGQVYVDELKKLKGNSLKIVEVQELMEFEGDEVPFVLPFAAGPDDMPSVIPVPDIGFLEEGDVLVFHGFTFENFVIPLSVPFVIGLEDIGVFEFILDDVQQQSGLSEKALLSGKHSKTFLRDVLLPLAIVSHGADDLLGEEMEDEMQDEVDDLLIDADAELELPEDIAEHMRLVWRIFCRERDPSVRKPENYAAAVVYEVMKRQKMVRTLTLAEVGELFDINPQSMKTARDKLSAFIDETFPARK